LCSWWYDRNSVNLNIIVNKAALLLISIYISNPRRRISGVAFHLDVLHHLSLIVNIVCLEAITEIIHPLLSRAISDSPPHFVWWPRLLIYCRLTMTEAVSRNAKQ
jgi:hypothetical protein